MKLLYIANIRFPTEKAHGLQIANTCQALSKYFDVALVIPNRKSHPHLKASVRSTYQISSKFQVSRLFCIDLLQFTTQQTNHLLRKLSFILQSISFAFSLFLFFSSLASKQIIYTRNIYISLPLRILGLPIFYELHTLPSSTIGKLIHQSVLGSSAGTIFISKSLKNTYASISISPTNQLVAHDATTINNSLLPKTTARKKLHLPHSKIIVLYTGSFYKWKGAVELIKASSHLADQFIIILIGGSPIEPSTQDVIKLASKYSPAKVKVIYHLPKHKLKPYLCAADILVLPTNSQSSQSSYNSPLKLFDYMAAQRPIVATDLTPVREILNSKSAVFVKPDSPKAIAKAITKLANSPKLSKQLSKRARQLVKEYTWEKRASKIAHFIKSSTTNHYRVPPKL